MIFVMDVGNTNIKIGVYDGEKLCGTWRLATDLRRTSDEYGVSLMSMLSSASITPDMIEGCILSSVVPAINFTVEHMLRDYLYQKPLMVNAGIYTGLDILIDNPKELGGDIICDVVSAFYRYGGPCVTIDFGTATTLGVTTAKGEFLGCAITTGLKISADAISGKAAKLPSIALDLPEKIIGKNTITCMQSGLLYGYIGQVEYLIARMKEEAGVPDAKVIATGGVAKVIAGHAKSIDIVDTKLTLEGLHLLYNMNQGR